MPLKTHHSITPLFPGPDLACRAGVAQTLLRKHYGENNTFQATRARAGQHSNWGKAPKFHLQAGKSQQYLRYDLLSIPANFYPENVKQ